MYLTQGLRRAAQIRPQEQSTAFRERRRIWSETVDRIARIAGGSRKPACSPVTGSRSWRSIATAISS